MVSILGFPSMGEGQMPFSGYSPRARRPQAQPLPFFGGYGGFGGGYGGFRGGNFNPHAGFGGFGGLGGFPGGFGGGFGGFGGFPGGFGTASPFRNPYLGFFNQQAQMLGGLRPYGGPFTSPMTSGVNHLPGFFGGGGRPAEPPQPAAPPAREPDPRIYNPPKNPVSGTGDVIYGTGIPGMYQGPGPSSPFWRPY